MGYKKKVKDNNKIALYFRVSSEQQITKGSGLDNQKKVGRDLAETLGFEIEEFDEGVQSTHNVINEDREVILRLIRRIESKKDPIRRVWVYNTNRFGRNFVENSKLVQVFHNYEVKVYQGDSNTPKDLSSFADRFMIDIFNVIASYDNSLRSMISNDGKRSSLKRGNTYIGGTIPFGFKVIDKKLKLYKLESDIVKILFKRYSRNESTKELKKWLDSNSLIKPRRSRTWSTGTIQKMLKNELYNGTQSWQWKEKLPNGEIKLKGTPIKLKVPKIIDDNTFKIVQRRITEITTLRIRSRKERDKTLLGGLLKCEKCKLQLSQRFREDKGYGNHYYGRCDEHQWRTNERKIPKSECLIQRSLRIEETDELVLNNLIDLIKKSSNIREEYRTELLNQKEKDLNLSKDKTKKIRKKIKNITNIIESHEDLIASTTSQITSKETRKSIGKKIIKESYKEIYKKHEELEGLNRELSILKDSSKYVDWIDIMSKDVSKIKSKPKDIQREWIRRFVKNIFVEYDTHTKSHKLKINFFIGLVDDSWKRIGRDTKGLLEYEITDGRKSMELVHKLVKKIEVIDKEYLRKVIVKINSLMKKEFTINQICSELNNEGIKTIRNKDWNKDNFIKFREKYVTRETIPK